jgi:hypothetical protein
MHQCQETEFTIFYSLAQFELKSVATGQVHPVLSVPK